MGRQYNKVLKRSRRQRYLKRKKAAAGQTKPRKPAADPAATPAGTAPAA